MCESLGRLCVGQFLCVSSRLVVTLDACLPVVLRFRTQSPVFSLKYLSFVCLFLFADLRTFFVSECVAIFPLLQDQVLLCVVTERRREAQFVRALASECVCVCVVCFCVLAKEFRLTAMFLLSVLNLFSVESC